MLNKRLLFLVFWLFMLVPGTTAAKPLDSLVSIEALRKDSEGEVGWKFSGSGTYMNDGTVVTAGHVLQDEPAVRICGYVSRKCETIESNKFKILVYQDIGIASVTTAIAEPARYSVRKPKLQDFVQVVSLPLGELAAYRGQIINLKSSKCTVLGIAFPGSSGSGVFDRNGKLIGVIVSVPISEYFGLPKLETSLVYVELL